MSFEPSALLVSLLFGAVGFVLFSYGKKQGRWPQMAGGVLLCVYPYFCDGLWTMIAVGAAIVAGVWLAVRQGW